MPANPVAILQPECGVDVVGKADRYVEEFAVAGGVVIGHGGFDEVTGAVVLVLFHVGPAFVEARQRVIRVQVSIGQLGSRDLVDPDVGFLLNGGIGVVFERVGHRFNGFVDVAVVVVDAFVFGIAGLPVQFPCYFLKVADAAGSVFGLNNAGLQRSRGYFVQFRFPELVGDGYLRKADRLKPLNGQLRVSWQRSDAKEYCCSK